MSEIETALLMVLIVVVILLLWRWVRSSANSCVKDCKDKYRWVSKAEGSSRINYGRGKKHRTKYSAMKPDLSGARNSQRDGYSDVSFDPSDKLYGPGSDSHDSYIAAHLGENEIQPGAPRKPGNDYEEYLRAAGLDESVFKGHKYFLTEMPHRTTGGSSLSITDHDEGPNKRMGLFRPDMHVAVSGAGARTVSSEDYRQMHPGNKVKWRTGAEYNNDC